LGLFFSTFEKYRKSAIFLKFPRKSAFWGYFLGQFWGKKVLNFWAFFGTFEKFRENARLFKYFPEKVPFFGLFF
jgi:hypothetical protein